jgi:DNA-binding transcriptional MerR regulator
MSLRIGDHALRTGVKVETIRWYEKVGLLPVPDRTQGNYRSYGADALRRLVFIRRARDLGFSLDAVRELLDLASDRSRDCAAVDLVAGRHLATVDGKLADLGRLRERLAELIASCAGGTVDDCRILDALDPDADE